MAVMAMFPLGGVLFPFAYLPLHVFEPRYLEMVRYCLDSDAEFGVVLIERGSEVGGGDQRHMVATSARIVAVEESPDGRFGLIAQGTRRIRVEQWLPDFNYPQAEVEPWADSSMVSSTDAVVPPPPQFGPRRGAGDFDGPGYARTRRRIGSDFVAGVFVRAARSGRSL